MKRMKKMVLLALSLLVLLPGRALAYDEIEVEIPVATNESSVIQLTGDFTDEQTIDGSGAFIVSVSHPGTYNCQVKQIPGEEQNKIYDERVYNVLIFVETAEGELRSSIVLSIDGEAAKPVELAFANETVLPPTPEEPEEPEEPTPPEEPEEPDEPDTPEEPSNPTKPQYHRTQHPNSDTPRTGDTNTVLIWTVVLLAGAALLAAVLIISCNKHRRK